MVLSNALLDNAPNYVHVVDICALDYVNVTHTHVYLNRYIYVLVTL